MTDITPAEHMRRLKPPTPRTVLMMVAIAAILVLLYLARDGLLPFAIGIVLVYVLSPVVRWLAVHGWRPGGKRGWSPVLSSCLSMIILVVAVVGLTIAILQPLIEQVVAYLKALPGFVANAQATLEGLNLPQAIEDLATKVLIIIQSIQAGFRLNSLVPAAQTVFGAAAILVSLAVVPFFTFYVLKDAGKLEHGVGGAIPAPWRADVFSTARIFNDRVGGYVRGIAIESIAMFLMVFVCIIGLGVLISPVFFQYALFLAIVAGIMEVLPFIGIFIAVIPALFVAISIGPQAVVGVVIVYGVLSQVQGSIVTPKVQNSAVDLHPALVMMVLILGFAVAGLVGALIAIPVIVAGRDIISYLYLRLGDEPPDPETAAAQFIKPRTPIRFRAPKPSVDPAESQT
jgi:predicted PurR-regulated permease PerM